MAPALSCVGKRRLLPGAASRSPTGFTPGSRYVTFFDPDGIHLEFYYMDAVYADLYGVDIEPQ